jgi:hypothetical protein
MIEGIIAVILFGAVYLFSRCATYLILFGAALLNIVLFPFTTPDHVFVEASITYLAITLLIKYGYREYWYQISLLIGLMSLYLFMEFGLIFHGGIIGGEETIISIITALQLFGGAYGVYTRIPKRVWKPYSLISICNRIFSPIGYKACEKKY